MKTILIADDDQDVRACISMRLVRNPRFRIVEAASGRDALDLARQEHPDLVILDWSMPGLNGIEFMQALREDPTMAETPVIMMTGKNAPAELAQARALGVCAYLVKPFDLAEILKKIQETLAEES